MQPLSKPPEKAGTWNRCGVVLELTPSFRNSVLFQCSLSIVLQSVQSISLTYASPSYFIIESVPEYGVKGLLKKKAARSWQLLETCFKRELASSDARIMCS
jgi:hypothetical protein